MSKKCQMCGNENPDDSVFCESCGGKIVAMPAGEGCPTAATNGCSDGVSRCDDATPCAANDCW